MECSLSKMFNFICFEQKQNTIILFQLKLCSLIEMVQRLTFDMVIANV